MKYIFTSKVDSLMLFVLTLFLWVSSIFYLGANAQNGNGTKSSLNKDDEAQVQNEDNRLKLFFDRSECGLNYIAISTKLTNRADPQQPVSNNLEVINIVSSIGVEVIGAYLYWVVEGGNPTANNTIRLSSPISSERLIGASIGRQSGGKCWGCNTYAASHYRADISHLVCKTDPNGIYTLSEYPTKWQACHPTPGNCICQDGDTDGATIVIIYKDFAGNYNGHLRLWDGLVYSEQGRIIRYDLSNVNFCAQPTQSTFTSIISDFQQFGNWQNNRMRINNRVVPIIPKFFNQESLNLPLNVNNTVTAEYFAENADCYTIILNAVYGRTANCPQVCQPTFNPPLPTVGVLPSLPFCAGTPPPTLSYSGYSGDILKWQYTIDCANGPWIDVDHQLPTYQPESLTRTTCFRVISKANACLQYSPVAQLTMTDQVDAGQTLGSNSYCERGENIRLTLSNRTGSVQFWEFATDPDCRVWQMIPQKVSVLNIPLVEQTTCYRTGIKFGNCDVAYTIPAKIEITSSNFNVTINGANAVCGQENNVLLSLQNLGGHRVLAWEQAPHCDSLGVWTSIPNTNNSINVELNQTTCYRAIVKSGNCPQKLTPLHRVEVTPATDAGIISAPQTVCRSKNQVILLLSGQAGNILRWESVVADGDETNPVIISNTTNRLVLIDVAETQKYRVVVKAGNCETKFSDWVQVTFSNKLEKGILTSSQTVCPNQAIQPLKLLNYRGTIARWEQSNRNMNHWFSVGMGGQDEFLPINITEDTWFRVVLTADGCGEMYSDTVKIAVKESALGGNLIGGKQGCEVIENAQLLLVGYVGNIISWQKRTENGNWENVSHNLSSYTVSNLTKTTHFRVEVANNNCGSVFSNSIIIQIDEPTIGGKLPILIDECAQSNPIVINLIDYNGIINFWERSVDSLQWVNIGNAMNPSLTLMAEPLSTYFFRVSVKNNSCNPAYSTIAKVTIRPPSVAGVLTKDTTACADSLSDLMLSLKGHRGNIMAWELSTDEGNTWSKIKYHLADYRPLIKQNSLYRVQVKNGNCSAVTSNSISIRLLPPVKGGILTGGGSICMGQNGHLLELQHYAGQIVRWETSKDLGNTWVSIGKAGFSSYQPSRLTVTTWFRVVVENGPCGFAFSNIAKIDVIPPSLGGTIIGGGNFCTLLGELALVNYRGSILAWEYSPDNGRNWQRIERKSANFPLNRIPGLGHFRVVVQNENCNEVRSQTAIVRLITPSQGGQIEGSYYVCRGGTSGIMSLKNHIGRVIRWEKSENMGGTWNIIQHALPIYESEPLYKKTLFRVLVQNESCNPVYSSMHTIDLVDQLFGGNLSADRVFCDLSDEVVLTLSGYSGSISHWEKSTDNFLTIQTINHFSPKLIVQNIESSVSFRVRLVSGLCDQVYSAPITVTLQPKPILEVMTYVGCDGKGYIEVNASGGSGFYSSFYLYKNGVLIRELRYPFNTFSGLELIGDYQVMVKDANGCTDAESVIFPAKAETPDIIDFPIVMTKQLAVRWNKVRGQNVRYIVHYRINGEPYWKTSEIILGTYHFLQNLQHDTEYEMNIIALCGQDTLQSSSTRFVRTASLGNCSNPIPPPPGGFYASFITQNSAQLNWNPLFNGIDNQEGYIISYGLTHNNPNVWAQWVVCHPTDRLILQNLSENTTYKAKIRTNCSNCTTAIQVRDRRSNWSEMIEFRTLKSQNRYVNAHDMLSDHNISLYPNPANDHLTISWDESNQYEKVISAFNILGQKIVELRAEKGIQSIVIPTSEWSDGIYRLEIIDLYRLNNINVVISR